jgi:uncharacterized protein
MYSAFGLVLMTNHACNLRCTYCYTGAKFNRPMPEGVGHRAIDRAFKSIASGGKLELGFFGGEPLLEARRIQLWMAEARRRADEAAVDLSFGLTTNGTLTDGAAWSVLTDRDVDLAISHDGLPEVHDRHRPTADGRGTAAIVGATLRRLLDGGREFRVIVVVRPSTLGMLADGLRHLQALGVRRVDLSLDLWTLWSAEDAEPLERALVECAELWWQGLPDRGLNWFDEKLARLSSVPSPPSARCGFGHGEIAVSPAGNLYPCERLIGEDEPSNPMRLPGHVFEGDGFLSPFGFGPRAAEACDRCALNSLCSTTCRCSNYVRTGKVHEPDGLLCLVDQVTFRETTRRLTAAARDLEEAAHVSR